MYASLVLNLALLIAISAVSGFIVQRWDRRSVTGAAMQGLLFGGAACMGMLRPAEFGPGLIFDGRSVVVSLCALFFGPVAGGLAALSAAAFRIWVGGEGMPTGLLVIASSAGVGILGFLRYRSRPGPLSTTELYLFGAVVHVAMLAMMLTLAAGTREQVLRQLALPILLTFPVATVLAGRILSDQAAAGHLVETLQRARKDLDITLRSIGDAVASTDMDGRIVRMNPVAETFTGWREHQARGRPIGDVFRITNGGDAGELVSRTIREQHVTAAADPAVLLSRDGTSRPVAHTAAPIRDDDGAVSGAVLVFSDRTVQEAARQQLKDAQERLQRVVRAGEVGLWDWDLRTHSIYFSPEWKRQLGYEDHEIPNENAEWDSRLHPADHDRVVESAQAHISGLSPAWSAEFRLRHRDGTYRHMLAHASTLFDDTGAPVRFVGLNVDITARVELQAQLLQAQKMDTVGRLAGGIAHDFNNLLTVINGTAELVLGSLPAGSPLRADLEQIQQAGDRAAALTRQLLAFSRKQVMAPSLVDLAALVRGMEEMLSRLLGEHVTLVVEPPANPCIVRADPGQVEQVIMNLAVNARDAMPEGGTLTIRTTHVDVDAVSAEEHPSVRPGAYVLMEVSDTGTGMDEVTSSRIFEPFFTTKDPGRGTGLGLSTAYGIIEQSGGTICVRSKEGVGTTFRIYLPRTTEVAGSSVPGPTRTAVRGTERILIVEDEELLIELTSRILRSAGYTVHMARSGAEALEFLERQPDAVELVLTDMVMPGMSGRELGARIARSYPSIRILYTSGYSSEMGTGGESGRVPEHFIGKPYSRAELTRRVRELLDSQPA
jgi:PAS domain S-box-containing protein